MKKILLLLFVSVFLISCNQNNEREKELDLRAKNLDLREKELDLREKELDLREKQLEVEKKDKSSSSISDILDNVYSSSARSAETDALISDLTNFASMAQQYYRKPTELGGGGNSFVGYQIPDVLKETANGSYQIEEIKSDELIMIGIGYSSNNPAKVKIIITPNEIRETKILN